MSTTSARYSQSYALVIGVNEYTSCSPLGYAVSDAVAVAGALKANFGFPDDKIVILKDRDATRSRILEAFYSHRDTADLDSRLVVFFAGHGITERSRKQEVGFLVPWDGSPGRIDSLIRWQELTHGSDLIDAKHILFVMDACYGGLAITRSLQPGSMRFLKDMLLRPARQVISAGKANELVSDLGGPLPGHSVFTGHLLEALNGKAAAADGTLTANGVMAYVYQSVGRDGQSQQTPHYGYLDGDGDFIFAAPILNEPLDSKTGEDTLVTVPAVIMGPTETPERDFQKQIKSTLTEQGGRIRLHDIVAQETRAVLSQTASDYFPVSGPWSSEVFQQRLTSYEEIIRRLCEAQILVSYWGESEHRSALLLPPRQLAGRLGLTGGTRGWLSLRWYPCFLMMYAGGIAAVAGDRYDSLLAQLHAEIQDPDGTRHGLTEFALVVVKEIGDVTDAFKQLPGRDRQYVPRSEYLFNLLQPLLDDLLFLGIDYERSFDRFEMLLALEHMHLRDKHNGHAWGPPGRFAWKHRGIDTDSPLVRLIEEQGQMGNSWPPLAAGFLGGSPDRFTELSDQLKSAIAGFNWH